MSILTANCIHVTFRQRLCFQSTKHKQAIEYEQIKFNSQYYVGENNHSRLMLD